MSGCESRHRSVRGLWTRPTISTHIAFPRPTGASFATPLPLDSSSWCSSSTNSSASEKHAVHNHQPCCCRRRLRPCCHLRSTEVPRPSWMSCSASATCCSSHPQRARQLSIRVRRPCTSCRPSTRCHPRRCSPRRNTRWRWRPLSCHRPFQTPSTRRSMLARADIRPWTRWLICNGAGVTKRAANYLYFAMLRQQQDAPPQGSEGAAVPCAHDRGDAHQLPRRGYPILRHRTALAPTAALYVGAIARTCAVGAKNPRRRRSGVFSPGRLRPVF